MPENLKNFHGRQSGNLNTPGHPREIIVEFGSRFWSGEFPAGNSWSTPGTPFLYIPSGVEAQLTYNGPMAGVEFLEKIIDIGEVDF